MTSVTLEYDYTSDGTQYHEKSPVDHDTQTWDNWGRTAQGLGGQCGFIALGTPDQPYDI